MSDPFGQAIYDFLETGKASDLVINTNYTEDERIPVSYLFRTEKEMPQIERTALKMCKGEILDVGAAAGCHSLVLQNKGFNVTALEISETASLAMQKRGINNVICNDIYSFKNKNFDTLLLLMNGAGIGGTVSGLERLLQHLKTILNPMGQILIDSSDIKYLFEEEDGSMWVDIANKNYYGEMRYEVCYKNLTTSFNWLFADQQLIKNISSKIGLKCHIVEEGDHYDYLAQLTL